MPPVEIRQFKGLNSADPETLIQDEQLASAFNVIFGVNGELKVRKGFGLWKSNGDIPSTLGPQDCYLLGLFQTYNPRATYIMANNNGEVFAYTNTGPWDNLGADTAVATPCVQISSSVYFGGGNKWDGTTFASVTGMPTHRRGTMVYHRSRLWTHDNLSVTTPNRVYFSTALNPDDWPVDNFIDIGDGDGIITQLFIFRDVLYVCKTTGMYALFASGPPENWIVRKQFAETGIINQSAREWNNKMYFVGNSGAYSFDGINLQLLSDPVQSYFGDGVSSAGPQAAGIWEDQYIIAVPSLSLNAGNVILVYNMRYGYWTQWEAGDPDFLLLSLLPVNQSDGTVSTDLIMSFFHAGSSLSVGSVRAYTGIADNCQVPAVDTPIHIRVKTKRFDFGSPLQMKRIKKLAAFMRLDHITVTQIRDPYDTTLDLAQDLSGDPTEDTEYKMVGIGYGRELQVKFEVTDDLSGSFHLYGILIDTEVKGRYSAKEHV